MPISRLFRLLYILLERERVPAPELAQTLEVSVRTIYRDVQTLGEAGIPVYAERGRDGGVAILPTFRLNKSMVSAAEKQDMLAALQALASTGASDRETLGKLSAFFGGQAGGLGAHRLCGLERNAQRHASDPRAERGHPEPPAARLRLLQQRRRLRAARGLPHPPVVQEQRVVSAGVLHAKARPAHLQAHAHQAPARRFRANFPTRRLPAWLTNRRKFNRTCCPIRFTLRIDGAWRSASTTI